MAPSVSRAPELLLSGQCGTAAPVSEVPAAAGEKTGPARVKKPEKPLHFIQQCRATRECERGRLGMSRARGTPPTRGSCRQRTEGYRQGVVPSLVLQILPQPSLHTPEGKAPQMRALQTHPTQSCRKIPRLRRLSLEEPREGGRGSHNVLIKNVRPPALGPSTFPLRVWLDPRCRGTPLEDGMRTRREQPQLGCHRSMITMSRA